VAVLNSLVWKSGSSFGWLGKLGKRLPEHPWKMSFLEEEETESQSPQLCVADVRQVKSAGAADFTR
jgi:hypothetical protein